MLHYKSKIGNRRHISQSEIRNSAAEKRGRAKIPSPQPPSFLPARASDFVSAARSAATSQFPPRSKKVRAFSNNGHQIGLRDFLEAKTVECSPRRTARLARNCWAKSNGGAKSQETIFSKMRRFVITKLYIKIIFYSNFLRKIPSPFRERAGLRRFFIPSPNTCLSAGR